MTANAFDSALDSVAVAAFHRDREPAPTGVAAPGLEYVIEEAGFVEQRAVAARQSL